MGLRLMELHHIKKNNQILNKAGVTLKKNFSFLSKISSLTHFKVKIYTNYQKIIALLLITAVNCTCKIKTN